MIARNYAERITAAGRRIARFIGEDETMQNMTRGEIKRALDSAYRDITVIFDNVDLKFNQMFDTAMQQYRKKLRDNDSGTWSQEARKFVIDEGIFVGSGTAPDGTPNFMWEDLLTREQCDQVLYRFARLA